MTDATTGGGEWLADTIVAVATPPGRGAVGMVRLSGPGAGRVLLALAPALGGILPPARRATLMRLAHPETGHLLDQAVVTRYEAPASYTGEDVVEISGHGGVLGPAMIAEACRAAGARTADPGEFTRRAYLHGKLDLVQVEAVADLVDARSRALHRASLGQLERGLSARIEEVRRRLVRVEAFLAHHVDFPEEDDAPVPVGEILAETAGLLDVLDALMRTAPEGTLLREGAVVVLAGRPNVGKSSLYNALAGEERALVTDVPGTTRDALEVAVELGGFPFRLVDTAGLRESDDAVERLGIEVARRALARADVVLLCRDRADPWPEEEAFLADLEGVPVVVVRTKADLRADGDAGGEEGGGPGDRPAEVEVSVRSGQGLPELRTLLPELVYGGLVEATADVAVVTRARQARALERGRDEIVEFRCALESGVPAEIAATHLRAAATAVAEVLGVVTTDDVLDVLFASFCVGK